MFMPHVDKRRALTEGKLEVNTRHADSETSFLLKSYFILIRPWLTANLLHAESNESNKVKIDTLLTMGQFERKRCSSHITASLKNYGGFPMDFSTYRHHQTGLMKLKCETENRSSDYFKFFGAAEYDSDDEEEAFEELTPLQKRQFEIGANGLSTAFYMYAHGSSKRGNISLEKNMKRIELNRKAALEWHADLGLIPINGSKGQTRARKVARTTSLYWEPSLRRFQRIRPQTGNSAQAEILSREIYGRAEVSMRPSAQPGPSGNRPVGRNIVSLFNSSDAPYDPRNSTHADILPHPVNRSEPHTGLPVRRNLHTELTCLETSAHAEILSHPIPRPEASTGLPVRRNLLPEFNCRQKECNAYSNGFTAEAGLCRAFNMGFTIASASGGNLEMDEGVSNECL